MYIHVCIYIYTYIYIILTYLHVNILQNNLKVNIHLVLNDYIIY